MTTNTFSLTTPKPPAGESAQPAHWSLPEMMGRLVEISGSEVSAALSIVFGLVFEAQQMGELVGWSTASDSSFYPPDVARRGVDLNSLVVVRVPDLHATSRAAEKLLRSGAFGLLVLDIASVSIPMPLQARLAGLTYRHHTALVFLTKKSSLDPSLGSFISLRVHTERKKVSLSRFVCDLKVLKDKRWGPTWIQQEICLGPVGLY